MGQNIQPEPVEHGEALPRNLPYDLTILEFSRLLLLSLMKYFWVLGLATMCGAYH